MITPSANPIQDLKQSTPQTPTHRSAIIADDDKHFSEILAEELTTHGLITQTLFDFDQAVTLLNQNHPDIILMDYYLPGQTGVQIINQVRQNSQLHHTTIILMSGENDVRYLAERINVPFLEKPFDITSLLTLLTSTSPTIKTTNLLDDLSTFFTNQNL